MPSLRSIPPLLATVLILATSSSALAQTQDDVDAASRRLEQASEQASADAVAATAAFTGLLAAIDRYNIVTTELSAVSRAIVDLETSALAAERALRTARDAERDAARTVYMTAFTGAGPGSLSIESVYESIITDDLLERITSHTAAALEETPAIAADLGERRNDLDEARLVAAALRGETDAAIVTVTTLLEDAEARAALSQIEVTQAQEHLELTIEERERRIRGIGARVVQWESLIDKYFQPAHFWQALEVMQCESGGDPSATNRSSDAAGLFQFLEGTWAFSSIGAGFAGASRYDAEANVASAAWLVNHSVSIGHPRGTWGHWECQPTSPPG